MNKSIIYASFVVALVSFAPMLPFIAVVTCFIIFVTLFSRVMLPP